MNDNPWFQLAGITNNLPNRYIWVKYESSIDKEEIKNILKIKPIVNSIGKLKYFGKNGWYDKKYHFEKMTVINPLEYPFRKIEQWPNEIDPTKHSVSKWIKVVLDE